ncbi:MAG: hypothetical protein AMXMBFR12_00100 [Candidatus Babeliales bacterium]
MKYMYAALLSLGLLATGLAQAKAEETKKTHVIKKKSTKKAAKPKARAAKVQPKTRKLKAKPKKQVYKNVKPARKPAEIKESVPTKTAEPISTPKTTEETAYQKFTNWLGLGTGAGTAAKQALVGHHRAAGYHIGPRDWHDNFPDWWVKQGRGWTSADVNGTWYFGGHPYEWWENKALKGEYDSYFKNVIRPTYYHAHPEKR